MNEHGFTTNNGRKGAKVECSFPSEKSIFDFLNINMNQQRESMEIILLKQISKLK